MRFKSSIVTTLAATMLLGSTSFAQQIKTDYDRNINFAQYKTYSWQAVKTRDPLMVDRIKSAVNAALAAKGWTEVPSGAEATLCAIEITRNQPTLNTFYDGFGGGWRWGGFGESTTTVQNYKVGTLVVDIFEANSKTLIWRGSASGTLSKSSEKNIKELDKSVSKMFHHFPPAEKARTAPES